MIECENLENDLNALKKRVLRDFGKESGLSNCSTFLESEDFRKMFLEIPDSFWQVVFSKRNSAQPEAPPQNLP